MSTFSPVGLWPSDGMRMRVCVWTEWTWSMHYVGMSTDQFILYYASAIHKHTHTHPFSNHLRIANWWGWKWILPISPPSPNRSTKNNNNKICQRFTLIFEFLCQQHAILWKLGNAGSGSIVHCEQDVSVIHYKTRNGKGITTSASDVSAVHWHQKKQKREKRTKRQILFIRYSAKIALLFFKSQLTTFNTEKSQGYSIFKIF